MNADVKYSLDVYDEQIDLTYYGYDENISWSMLTMAQQNEIIDSLRAEKFIRISVEEKKKTYNEGIEHLKELGFEFISGNEAMSSFENSLGQRAFLWQNSLNEKDGFTIKIE